MREADVNFRAGTGTPVTFSHLIKTVPWNEVQDVLVVEVYDGVRCLDSYIKAWKEIRDLPAMPCPYRLRIEPDPDQEPPYCAYPTHVYALCPLEELDPSDRAIMSQPEPGFVAGAIDLTPWPEILGMPVSTQTLEKYSGAQIIAHTLCEITFHGFSAGSSQAVAELLLGRAADIEKAIEDNKN
jgi:hypothetical protein